MRSAANFFACTAVVSVLLAAGRAACACLLSLNAAADSYPVNYLSAKLGASVATESKLSGKSQPNDLLSDGPVSKGRISFAGIPQRRMFTVDLGSVRTFDRVEISVGGADPASHDRSITPRRGGSVHEYFREG